MQFKFPLLHKNGQEIKEVEELLQALQAEKSGFFPIDTDGLWHNGLHFTDNVQSGLAIKDPICCIADGEVVAYQLPANYQQTTIDGIEYPYSNAMTLVRHVYETPKGNILVFFSLYMNLLPFKAYSSQVLPAYLQGNKVYIVAEQAKDREDFAGGSIGLRVRHEPAGEVIALLPQGVKLSLAIIDSTKTSTNKWKQVDSLLDGSAIIKPGWVWRPELDEPVNGRYTVGDKAADMEDFAPNAVGLRMRAVARGRVVAMLPRGTQVVLDSASAGKWRKVKKIVSGDPVLAPGWVYEPELKETLGLSGNVRYQVKVGVADIEDEIATDLKGLRIRLAPNGSVMGLLKAGDILTLGERQGSWAKIMTAESNANPEPIYKKGWVWLSELDQLAATSQYYRVGSAARDQVETTGSIAGSTAAGNEIITGLNLRLEPNGFLIGLLPRGSTLELGVRQNQWAQVKTLHEGKPIYNMAWVWVPELDVMTGNLYQVGDKANDKEATFAPGIVGIRMRDLPSRAIVALLPQGTQLELEPHNNRWAKVRRITTGEAIYPPVWVWVPELDAPKAKEKVYRASPQARDRADFAQGEKGLNMRLSPNGVVLGLLTKDVLITLVSSDIPGWSQVSGITSGEPFYNLGWVWVPELDRLSLSRYSVGNLAQDTEPSFAPDVTGIRMRHFFSREILALIPQGAELELESHTGRWAKVKSISRKQPVYRQAWVWKPELEEVLDQATSYSVGNVANDIQPDFAGSSSGLRMRTSPGGDIMALIPKGVELDIAETQGAWGRVKNFMSGKPIYAPGWVWTPDLNEINTPEDSGKITFINQKIKAGETIGYAGKYHDLSEQNQHRFHLQVFTSDNLPKFMSNPFQDTGGKDLLIIPPQTPLFDQVETDAGMDFAASGVISANETVLDAEVRSETDRQGVDWIPVSTYSINNPSEQGWVKKVAAQRVSSLIWPGFSVMDTTNEAIADIDSRDVLEQIYSSYLPPTW